MEVKCLDGIAERQSEFADQLLKLEQPVRVLENTPSDRDEGEPSG
jgi:hypothetical protein